MDDLNEDDLEEVSWQAAQAALAHSRVYPHISLDSGDHDPSRQVPKGRRGSGSRAESALLHVLSDQPLPADEQAAG